MAAGNWAQLSSDDPELGFLIAVEAFEAVEASSSGQNDTKDVAAAIDWLILLGWP